MKCPACGRTMVERGMHAHCPNILCDYEEEIESGEAFFASKRDLPAILLTNFGIAPC